ncbi:MAG: hypothetical protein ACK456_16715 [Pseudanabaenaceae cyanobacterium]
MNMFNLRNLLFGLVITLVSFGASNNLMVVFAQDQQVSRYLSDEEVESTQPDQSLIQYYQDKRTRYEVDQITKFSSNWGVIDSSIVPFLGKWGGWEHEFLSVYPSNIKGRSCIILTSEEAVRTSSGYRNVYTHRFGIGKISGDKLLVEMETGDKFVLAKRIVNTRYGTADILGLFNRISGRNTFFAFAFPRLLEPLEPEKLRQSGCTTLPPKNLPRSSNSVASLAQPVIRPGIYGIGSRYILIANNGSRVCYQGVSGGFPGRYAIAVGETTGSLSLETGKFIIDGWKNQYGRIVSISQGQKGIVITFENGELSGESVEYQYYEPFRNNWFTPEYTKLMSDCLNSSGEFFKTNPGYVIKIPKVSPQRRIRRF